MKMIFSKQVLSLLSDPSRLSVVIFFILIAEAVINCFVIEHVMYTEIDWRAYMQEVEGVLNRTYDYTYLKGDTGPLVYPAGFVYAFTMLYWITDHGENIRLAQYIFAVLYLVLLWLVLRIYSKSRKVPPIVLIMSSFSSYRIHSIFILRLFNDPVAMLLFYASVNLILDSKWILGSIFYSLAVSVKMNILLFAPAMLLAYLTCLGVVGTVTQLTVCAFVQLLLGLPFILANPFAYISGAFNLGRVFLYEWTVNWRFLPEDIFISKYFHICLLILHIVLILYFFKPSLNQLQRYAELINIPVKKKGKRKHSEVERDVHIRSQLFLQPLFTANLIGITFSRSLHYQFYIWYFHSLPFLLWSTPLPVIIRLCILGVIELCWNTFPSTCLSSISLHLCHVIMLLGLRLNKQSIKRQ